MFEVNISWDPFVDGFRNLHQVREFKDSVCHSRVGLRDDVLHDYTNALFAYIIYFQAGRNGHVKNHTIHKVSIPVWKALVARLRVMAVIHFEYNG
jgi:hypothetical protein